MAAGTVGSRLALLERAAQLVDLGDGALAGLTELVPLAAGLVEPAADLLLLAAELLEPAQRVGVLGAERGERLTRVVARGAVEQRGDIGAQGIDAGSASRRWRRRA